MHDPSDRFSRALFDGFTPTTLSSLLIASAHPFIPADRCPNLRSFRLKTQGLEFDHPYLPPLLRFLSLTPLLENLWLDMGFWATKGGEPLPRPVSLPRLHNVSLAGWQYVDWSDIILPAVRSSLYASQASNLTDFVVDITGGCETWLVSGRPRTAHHILVKTAFGLPYHNAQESLPQWLVEEAKTLRFTMHHVRPYISGVRSYDVRSFKSLHTFHKLETLIVRVPTGDHILPRLGLWLVGHTAPPPCASLRTLVVSILNPRCALETLHPLNAATARRAELKYPLQRLFVCSPAHAGPDYSVRDLHGVEWVTFSSLDVGAPCRDVTESIGVFDGGATPALSSQPREEHLYISQKYEAVWEACATRGLVDARATMYWFWRSRLW